MPNETGIGDGVEVAVDEIDSLLYKRSQLGVIDHRIHLKAKNAIRWIENNFKFHIPQQQLSTPDSGSRTQSPIFPRCSWESCR